jgi:hypothetical protein
LPPLSVGGARVTHHAPFPLPAHRPVQWSEYPASDTTAPKQEQGRGNRSSAINDRYNANALNVFPYF